MIDYLGPGLSGASPPSAAIEFLESRTLLTSVVVNTISDTATGTGVVTLADAVKTANSSSTPTTITFSPTVFAKSQTITLNGVALELSNTKESTTITGPSVRVTISGNKKSRESSSTNLSSRAFPHSHFPVATRTPPTAVAAAVLSTTAT